MSDFNLEHVPEALQTAVLQLLETLAQTWPARAEAPAGAPAVTRPQRRSPGGAPHKRSRPQKPS